MRHFFPSTVHTLRIWVSSIYMMIKMYARRSLVIYVRAYNIYKSGGLKKVRFAVILLSHFVPLSLAFSECRTRKCWYGRLFLLSPTFFIHTNLDFFSELSHSQYAQNMFCTFRYHPFFL